MHRNYLISNQPSKYIKNIFCCMQDLTTIEVLIDGINYCLYLGPRTAEVIENGSKYEGCIMIPSCVKHNSVEYSVTSIGNFAFFLCSSLTSINIPHSVTSIGDDAFYCCKSLVSIIIPNSVKNIGCKAFYGCDSLTSITIPNSVTTVNKNLFYGCSALTSITLGDAIKSIGYNAFCGCESLSSIIIPSSVTSIDTGAFEKCSSLVSINLPDGITTIKWSSFEDCSSLKFIALSNSITEIEGCAFKGCTALCFIVLPESIKHIGDSAFEDCSSLKRISLPYSLEHIGRNAFRHCSSLVGINIPTKVKELHAGTFAFCDNLIWAKLNTQIYYSRYFNPQVNSVFYQTHKDFQIVVSPNMLYDYKNHSSFNIYRITDKWLIPNRSWNDCVEEWENYMLWIKSSDMPINKSYSNTLSSGLRPFSFPPIGICLTVDEYNLFTNEGRDLKQIFGWCESGEFVHTQLRLIQNIDISRYIGLDTPRKGFYKIVEICTDNKTYKCYYNYQRSNVFNNEIVIIRKQPFYNYVSDGPKDEEIMWNDVIEVKEDVQSVDCEYQGDYYKAYRVVWNFIVHNQLGTELENLTTKSYKQYGGYNGWDDDTINSAFEGEPSATWNID